MESVSGARGSFFQTLGDARQKQAFARRGTTMTSNCIVTFTHVGTEVQTLTTHNIKMTRSLRNADTHS